MTPSTVYTVPATFLLLISVQATGKSLLTNGIVRRLPLSPPDGLYQFKVMPFGLCNAPATFERMMDSLLRGFKWTMCLCYLDDVVVFSSTFESHIRRLATILAVFRRTGLQLNSKKCTFGQRQIKVLGHLVDASGVKPDPDKVRAVHEFPTPRSSSDVRSFLGLCSYFRRFIPNFADTARPLTTLLKKDVPFSWGLYQAHSFTALVAALTAPPVLAHFDPSPPTELRTDASGHGIGAILA
uniref:RNA-directed DNA polymerase n=1 Tax=Amblyomma cajennense TaxID=34607 RepID=A0A023FPK4_AMBCJ